jgi:hypothetical protein
MISCSTEEHIMAPRQPFLWVNTDSRGKSDSSARQTSNIKSHCAQYYYQSIRERLWAASDDLAVPNPTLVGSSRRLSGRQSQYTEQDQAAAHFHHTLVPSSVASDLEAEFEQSTQQTKKHRSSMKKRNAQQWRKVRCTRFRKVRAVVVSIIIIIAAGTVKYSMLT